MEKNTTYHYTTSYPAARIPEFIVTVTTRNGQTSFQTSRQVPAWVRQDIAADIQRRLAEAN